MLQRWAAIFKRSEDTPTISIELEESDYVDVCPFVVNPKPHKNQPEKTPDRFNSPATKFDRKERCGAEANMAKLLASEAAWEAANVCLTTHGGYGFATEYDVERKFRETRLLTVAPVSNNLVLAYLGQHVLGMPRSY